MDMPTLRRAGIALAVLLSLCRVGAAAEYSWNVPVGDWSLATNWTNAVPTANDDAWITNSGTAAVTQLGEVCNNLYLDGASNLQITSGSFTESNNAYVGYSGTGSFAQSGGRNSLPSGYLMVGWNPGGNGSYSLSGSGLLTGAFGEFIGYYGLGSFAQSGGTNSFSSSSNLYLGASTGGNGSYSLSGSGLLSGAQYEYVGYLGTGSFTQSGGTNSLGSGYLDLGGLPGSSGSYNLSGSGLLSVAQYEYVGYSGTGSFTQSGGTNSLPSGIGGLYLGWNTGTNGTYILSGSGLLTVATNESVGQLGTGRFTQSGGTNSVSNELSIGTGGGSYILSGSRLLSVANVEVVGNSGTGSFTHSGGTNSLVSGTLYIGYGGSGSYILSGSGLLTGASTEYLGVDNSGTGSFTQSGGTNSLVSGTLYIGDRFGSGSYILSGSGLLRGASSEYIGFGYSDTGSFTQSGGTNTLPFGVLYLGWNAGSSGSYNLGSGLLSGAISEFVGYSGTGSFTQSGGTNSVSGTLILAQFAGSAGPYNLNGGLLSLAGLTAGSGAAALNFGGGTLGAAVPWSSSVNMTLTGSGGNATVDTTGGSIALSGNLSGPSGLTKIGAGTLVLSGSNTYSGGTDVVAGTLIVNSNKALPTGTNLTVGANAESVFHSLEIGTTFVAPESAISVPEPSSLALIVAGAVALLRYASRRWSEPA